MSTEPQTFILFYDGLCGFCDRTVRYVLARDAKDRFRFAALQGEFAGKTLPGHGKNPLDLDSMFLLKDGIVYERSDAAIQIGKALGKGSKLLATLVGLLPKAIRNWGYDRIARMRYRLFGKLDACRIPNEKERAKFIG